MPLVKIKDQLTKENWTTGTLAADKDNFPVDVFSDSARRWCAYGWIKKVYGNINQQGKYIPEMKKLLSLIKSHHSITSFNDWSSFEEVKAKFEEADI